MQSKNELSQQMQSSYVLNVRIAAPVEGQDRMDTLYSWKQN
jgi:hypothetical protein